MSKKKPKPKKQPAARKEPSPVLEAIMKDLEEMKGQPFKPGKAR